VRDPRRLVSFAAVWHRRQIWTVRLHQQSVAGNETEQIIVRPFFERHDSGEGNVPAGVERKLGEAVRSRVAVENSNDTRSFRFPNHRSGVILGVPGVDDDGLPRFRRKLQLRSEGGELGVARRVVVVVVEPAFADSDGGIAKKLPQSGQITRRLERGGVMWVHAGGGEHEARIVSGEAGGQRRCLE